MAEHRPFYRESAMEQYIAYILYCSFVDNAVILLLKIESIEFYLRSLQNNLFWIRIYYKVIKLNVVARLYCSFPYMLHFCHSPFWEADLQN